MSVKAGKLSVLVLFIVFTAVISVALYLAMKGRKIKLRTIPGLDAIAEGVGRAVELRRPVAVDLHTGGLRSIDGVVALSYLGYVAKRAAAVAGDLVVATGSPETTPVAEDIVRAAYIASGKPDVFKPEMIRFLSPAQWGYTGGWLGLVGREKPGMILLAGSMGAEVMIVAEAGQWAGAMQVACSTSLVNIPFLVASCDYVIIGEENYAGAAIISQDPVQLGSIIGQDYVKLVIISLIVLGSLLATLGSKWLVDLTKM